jgi:hypothetical protein
LGALWGSFGLSGDPWGSLGDPLETLGGSLEVSGVHLGSLGGPLGVSWGSLGDPWSLCGFPWGPWGVPWGSWGVSGESLVIPGGSLGVLGGPWGSQGGLLGTYCINFFICVFFHGVLFLNVWFYLHKTTHSVTKPAPSLPVNPHLVHNLLTHFAILPHTPSYMHPGCLKQLQAPLKLAFRNPPPLSVGRRHGVLENTIYFVTSLTLPLPPPAGPASAADLSCGVRNGFSKPSLTLGPLTQFQKYFP